MTGRIDRAELRRLEVAEADRRRGLLARLVWQYGPEEGARRFRGEAEAEKDLEAWNRVGRKADGA